MCHRQRPSSCKFQHLTSCEEMGGQNGRPRIQAAQHRHPLPATEWKTQSSPPFWWVGCDDGSYSWRQCVVPIPIDPRQAIACPGRWIENYLIHSYLVGTILKFEWSSWFPVQHAQHWLKSWSGHWQVEQKWNSLDAGRSIRCTGGPERQLAPCLRGNEASGLEPDAF